MKKWTEQENEYLRENYPKVGTRCCVVLKRTRLAVISHAFELKISFNLPPIPISDTKTCPKCKTQKSKTDYHKDNGRRDKLKFQCKDCARKYLKSHYQTNANYRNIVKKSAANYRDNPNNKLKIKEGYRKWVKKQKKANPIYRIKMNLRRRLVTILKQIGKKKEMKFVELVGCSKMELKELLEGRFQDGMSWDNYGRYSKTEKRWNVDHKIPCKFFDLSLLPEQKKCFNFKNLQPMWAIDNILKRDRLIY